MKFTLFIDTAQHVKGVVREKSLVVQSIGEHLSDGRGAHFLAVHVLVALDSSGQQFVKSLLIGLHTRSGNNGFVSPKLQIGIELVFDTVNTTSNNLLSKYMPSEIIN
jgi:hypothetical protein